MHLPCIQTICHKYFTTANTFDIHMIAIGNPTSGMWTKCNQLFASSMHKENSLRLLYAIKDVVLVVYDIESYK